MRAILFLSLTLAMGSVGHAAEAQSDRYPSKSIRIVVPFAPGGSNDLLARVMSQKFNEAWGQPAIIDNRAGGGSTIGIEAVVRSPPDGHTLLMTSGGIAINVSLYKLSFHPVKDLAPVALMAQMPYLVAVNPALPVKSTLDLVNLAKSQPGKITFASSGAGTSSHLMGEMFRSHAKVNMLHIPFKGGAPAVSSVISGEVQVIFNVITGTLPHARSGKLRGLAVSSAQRVEVAPDIPTVAESGLPGFEVIAWYNMFAPAGTPRPIINQINATTNRIINQPDVRERFLTLGVVQLPGPPLELGEYLNFEIDRWAKLIKENGFKAE